MPHGCQRLGLSQGPAKQVFSNPGMSLKDSAVVSCCPVS
jgi:hypothetical protein